MTSLRNDDGWEKTTTTTTTTTMGGTASLDGNLAQLSKVSKYKPPIKRNLTRSGNLF